MIEIIYKESKGDINCCICKEPLYGKYKKGSEETSYCLRCFKGSLQSITDSVLSRASNTYNLNKN